MIPVIRVYECVRIIFGRNQERDGHDAVLPLPYGHHTAAGFHSGSACQRTPAGPTTLAVSVVF